jgi:hypothetical protein
MANYPPFATLNHFTADLGIPKRVEIIAGWYKTIGEAIKKAAKNEMAAHSLPMWRIA